MATGTTVAYQDGTPPPWVYQQPASIVIDQIDKMSDRATSSLDLAQQVMDQLSTITLDPESAAPPDIQFPTIPGSNIARPDKPSVAALGNVDPFDAPVFTEFQNLYDQLDAVVAGLTAPGDFTPSVDGIVIPPAPAPIDGGDVPVRPELTDPTIPDAPEFTVPTLDSLLELNLPTFVMPDFPVFEDMDVEFDGAEPNPVLTWNEPQYQSTLLNDLTARIRTCLAGGTGMTPEIEAALFDQARGREDTTALKRTQEATATWAGRGL